MATKNCGGSLCSDGLPVKSSIDDCVFLFLETGSSMKSVGINMQASISYWTVINPSMINNIVSGGSTNILILVTIFLYNFYLR